MSLHAVLIDLVLVLAATVAVLLLGARIRVPAVVGFLVTGILIGPSGLGAVREPEIIDAFAEIGVVLLLFTIGLEFSLERLRRVGRIFLVGGTVQAAGTIALVALLTAAIGASPRTATFYGMLAALSSTAIVLKLYAERREIDTPHGQVMVGMLIFQDVLIVPAILVTPILAGSVEGSAASLLLRLATGLGVVAVVFLLARYVTPALLRAVARTRSRELFVLGALFTCVGMAMVTEALGFSLALGAFLAGVLISESGYSHQAVADISPFRDVFASLFFVSIGMLLDVEVVRENPLPVIGLTAAVVVIKAAVTGGATWIIGYPVRTVVLAGIGLAQVGEFSFVLAQVGAVEGLLRPVTYQLFLATAVLTMMAAPLLVGAGDAVARRAQAFSERRGGRPAPTEGSRGEPKGHVVLVGLGEGGRILARVLRSVQIPFVVIELSERAARSARSEDLPVLFGDATRRDVLEAAGIADASVSVFAISDPQGTRRAVRLARELAPDLYILVRTRQVAEIEPLYETGASEVVAEEFESSIELFMRVLDRYHVPAHVIDAQARVLRQDHYRRLLGRASGGRLSRAVMDVLAQGTTATAYVASGTWADGRSLGETRLRERTGATVIAIVRDGRATTSPSPDVRIRAGDALVLVGSHEQLVKAIERFERVVSGDGAEG
jgi:CPA2 family monovalent cation:H+ antiporter-2